jgi:hypothetical protein
MLGDYSRRLQDYSLISGSTFQTRDASSILESFWPVVLRDAWELLVKTIKTTLVTCLYFHMLLVAML